MASQLGKIRAKHLERGGMARPERPERSWVVDFLQLPPEGCAKVQWIGVGDLDPDLADAFPMFEAGDLMISLREIATVAVLDGEARRIKWFTTGPFLGQRAPDFLPNGNTLLYDNRITGARPELGYSRVLEIDPVTRAIVWQYAGTDQDPMHTDIGGRVQLLPNGNVLAVESQGGRIIEIAREVSQFVNLQDDGLAGHVFDGLRFAEDELGFVGQPCP